MEKIKVFIADDHAVYREGLKYTLRNDSRYSVVGEASTGKAALVDILRTQPDITFIDILMPELDGVSLVKEIKKNNLTTKIIILSQFVEHSQINEFIELGINSYIIKSEPTEEILRSLHALTLEVPQNYFSPVISQKLFSLLKESQGEFRQSKRVQKSATEVTPRELEIGTLVSKGKTNKEIALNLGCSEHTIKSHKSNLMRKIGARSAAEISAWVVRAEL